MRSNLLKHSTYILYLLFLVALSTTKAHAQSQGPQVTVDFPSDGTTITNSIITISGTVTDMSGNGIDRIRINLYDSSNNLSYNFVTRTYSRFPSIVIAELSDSDNSLSTWTFQYPPLPTGNYTAMVRARDADGDQSESSDGRPWIRQNFSVEVSDTIPPTVEIETAELLNFSNGTFLNVAGSVSDSGGAGIERVKVGFYDTASKQWFDFSSGNFSETGQRIRFAPLDFLDPSDPNYNRWSSLVSIPPSSTGPFRAYVQAVDRSGNLSSDPSGRSWARSLLE